MILSPVSYRVVMLYTFILRIFVADPNERGGV